MDHDQTSLLSKDDASLGHVDDVVESSPGRVGSGVRSGSANLNRNNSGRSSGRNRGGGGGGFDLINVTKKFTNHLFFSK